MKDNNADKKSKAQKAFVEIYFKDNVFFKHYPDMFFQVWKLIKENSQNWQNLLNNDANYTNLKTWLMTLFVNEKDKSKMTLWPEDIAKLVLNNITRLPNGCRCKMRDLPTNVD